MNKNKNKNKKLSTTGMATIATGITLLPLLEGVAHMGPFGMFLSFTGTYVAYRHADQVAGIVSGFANKFFESEEGEVSSSLPLAPGEVKIPHLPKKSSIKEIQRKDGEILLGLDSRNQLIYRAMKKLKSMLILGLSGKGKTSTCDHILRQLVEQGAQFVLVDPNALCGEESLTEKVQHLQDACLSGMNSEIRSLEELAATMEEAVDYATDQLNQRIAGGACDFPLYIVVDELTMLLAQLEGKEEFSVVAEKLVALLKKIILMGRKIKVFAIAIGQATNADHSGGTVIRDLFPTRIVHCMHENQIKMLRYSDHKKQILNLKIGEVFVDIEEETPIVLKVPLTAKADLPFKKDSLSSSEGLPQGPEGLPRTENLSYINAEVNLGSIFPDSGEDILPSMEGCKVSLDAEEIRKLKLRVNAGESNYSIAKSLGVSGGRSYRELNEFLSSLRNRQSE